jgi:hypothetical protein
MIVKLYFRKVVRSITSKIYGQEIGQFLVHILFIIAIKRDNIVVHSCEIMGIGWEMDS